jgi:hypothetical protein
MPTSGFYWHCHHEKLVEWCYDFGERVDYIRTQKQEDEQETRLRLFKPVRGKLPKEVVEASRAYAEASRAYDKARRACVEAYRAYDEASQAHDEAIARHLPAIQALHAQECPNCPWDGETIFPE